MTYHNISFTLHGYIPTLRDRTVIQDGVITSASGTERPG